MTGKVKCGGKRGNCYRNTHFKRNMTGFYISKESGLPEGGSLKEGLYWSIGVLACPGATCRGTLWDQTYIRMG
jgi:hypothetical protein